jgi:hypothetical protein
MQWGSLVVEAIYLQLSKLNVELRNKINEVVLVISHQLLSYFLRQCICNK